MMKKNLLLALMVGFAAPVVAMDEQSTSDRDVLLLCDQSRCAFTDVVTEATIELPQVTVEVTATTPEQQAVEMLVKVAQEADKMVETKTVSEEEAALIVAQLVEEIAKQNPEIAQALQTDAQQAPAETRLLDDKNFRRDMTMGGVGLFVGGVACLLGLTIHAHLTGSKN